MELLLPEKWYKTIIGVWDLFLDKSLAKLFGKNQKNGVEDAAEYYDFYRRTWSSLDFEKQFETWPRADLINKIKMYEVGKQAQFRRLWQKDKHSWNIFMEKFRRPEKKVLAQAFDEAFK